MLAKLVFNNDVTARSQQIAKTIAGVMAGIITSTADLGASFYKDQSSFVSGGIGVPNTYWTIAYDNSSSTAGYIILTKPSAISGKTNYLKIEYTYYTQIILYTGTGISNNDLVNPSTGVSAFYHYYSVNLNYKTLFIRLGERFVHTYIPIVDQNNYIANTIALEMTGNAYDSYSQEGTLKILSTYWSPGTYGQNVDLYISNKYNPSSLSYSPGSTLLSTAYNIIKSRTYGICDTRGEDLINNEILLVPIIINNFSTGWLGENLSTITGLYFGSTRPLSGGEYVTIGSTTYIVIPPDGCYLSTGNQGISGILLAKI
jgi:hypothetical protein